MAESVERQDKLKFNLKISAYVLPCCKPKYQETAKRNLAHQ